ncbi:MAG: nucleotidyltransferase family protein [Candidatus Buchananbacteria bacterium]|nr:nucleotidyltransferase family protein [Candidatus Buchananbacteria bacterium]
MQAIILAGGEGTRLRPFTYEIPKGLMPVHGKPLNDHVLDILKKAGVTEALLSIGYLADRIKDYYQKNPYPDIAIDYLVEEDRMGTAGPLILMKRQGMVPSNHFIVVNGDNLYSLDLDVWKDFHFSNNGAATLALAEIDINEVSSRGVAKMDGSKIIDFVEKPKVEEAPSNLINSGYYIFSPEVFDYIDEAKDFLMLEKDVFPALAKAGRLFGYKGQGQWFDTGTIERYDQVIKEWKGV